MEQSQIVTKSLPQKAPLNVASVALEVFVGKLLDYEVPPHLATSLQKGHSVTVPLRGQLKKGIVVEIKEHTAYPHLLPIHELIFPDPLLPSDLLDLGCWMSRYYITSLERVLKKILPTPVLENKGHKQQYFVTAGKSKEILRNACIEMRSKHPAQAKILDEVLAHPKGLFLTELFEITKVSKSPLMSLVKKKLIHLNFIEINRSPLASQEYFQTYPKKLNEEQQNALQSIVTSLKNKKLSTHLLFGVTGSGKTEIYLQAIAEAQLLGKGTIVLVPEISLTAQTIEKFKSRFNQQIAILHHRLSEGERYDEWHRIFKGEATIVIGARSALFSPVKNLGLIIVDEEHDNAYKQSEDPPCYHARDVAVMRGKISDAVVILGSATPSFESYHNALSGKYILSPLKKRVGQARLPQITVIDMKKEQQKAGRWTLFSEKLISGIKERFQKGEQSLLFLNRRGYHTSLLCSGCGYTFLCTHCEKALTFHFGEKTLACHLCGEIKKPLPEKCPQCHASKMLKYKGIGTEHVERALAAIAPEIRTLRIDGDTTRHKGSHEKFFRAFSTGKSDCLIGTQMITKGLHFPSVTLVAVLNCDQALQIPDFRSAETAFQIMTQVSGRAGRGELEGEVLLQTFMPTNDLIQMVKDQNFEAFYHKEIESRSFFGFPPYSRLVKFTFSGKSMDQTFQMAKNFRSHLCNYLDSTFTCHPLQPSGHPKVKDMYRFQFLIGGQKIYTIRDSIEKTKQEICFSSKIKLLIDVDPISTFF